MSVRWHLGFPYFLRDLVCAYNMMWGYSSTKKKAAAAHQVTCAQGRLNVLYNMCVLFAVTTFMEAVSMVAVYCSSL